MANPTEVYSVKFDVKSALEALGRLESKLSAADKHARDLLQERKGSEIDDALKRTNTRALKLRQQFEKSQAAIAAVTRNAAKETRKQTSDTKKLTNAGKSLDQMMRKFSRNASTGQRKVARAIEGTAKAVKKTDENLKKIPGSAKRASRGIRGVGTAGALASQSLTQLIAKTSAFIGVLAGIRDVSREYGDFDQAMTSAVAKFSRLEPALKPGTEAFVAFKNEIRAATEGTEHSAAGAARAADFWAKAGRTSTETKAVLKTTLDFASANQDASGAMLDVSRAGDILSDALGQFRMPMSTAEELMASTARVADVMSDAANGANMSAEELFESFKGAGPTLKLVGSDIEETSALLAAMANAGIKGAAAGTQLKMSIANLSAMTAPQEAAMRKLGVSVKDADGNFRGLTTIIHDLNEATKEMGTADRAQVFAKAVGRRALPSFINLLATGKVALDKTTEALKNAGGGAERLAETMRKSAQAQMARFQNKLRGVGFEIIEKTKIIEHLTRTIDNIDWSSIYQTIEQDVIPTFKTVGKIISETIIPAFRRAYRLISSIFNPVLEISGWLFEKLGKSGQSAERVLGYLITAWVSYRAILLSTKAVGILEWFAKLITSMGAATTAQGALNTQAAATNRTLGAQVKGFGKVQSAMAALGVFAAGWTIGTVIYEELVEPFMKARHELKLLTEEFEANKKSKDAPKKQTYGAIAGDLETAKKVQARRVKKLQAAKTEGGGAAVPYLESLVTEAESEIKRLESKLTQVRQRSYIERYDISGEEEQYWSTPQVGRITEYEEDFNEQSRQAFYSPELPSRSIKPDLPADWRSGTSELTPEFSYAGVSERPDVSAELSEQPDVSVDVSERPDVSVDVSERPDVFAGVSDVFAGMSELSGVFKEQSELAKQRATADAEYQKKSLEMMKLGESKNPVTNITTGDTHVTVNAKNADAAEVARLTRKELDKRAREDHAAVVAGTRTLAPAEV